MDSNRSKSASPRILVVDDERVNRIILSDVFAREGFEIVEAASGPEAVEIVQKQRIDLVLCDVSMPGMSGLEVCRALKGDEATRYIPFIIVTGLRASTDRIRGIEEGADDYLFKPVNAAEVLARVRSTLRLGAYRRILAEREKFEAAMAQMSDGLVHLRSDWSVCAANAAARRLLDLPEGCIVGSDLLAHLVEHFELSAREDELRDGTLRQPSFDLSRSPAGPGLGSRPPLVLAAALTRVAATPGESADQILCVRNVTEEREQSRVKDRFIALMSHKLRTPITILLGHVDLLATESSHNLREDQRESITAVERAAKELGGLFDRILTFVELSAHEPGTYSIDVRLSQLLERVAALATRVASRKPISVDVVAPAPGAAPGNERIVRVDPHLMDVVFKNLIENAVKFSHRDSVRIGVEQVTASADDRVAIAVTDDGPGVPPELRDRVFEQFDQIDPEFSGNVDGLGLGLPLARRIIEKQGGSIRLRSAPGNGSGATIVIELPASPCPGARPSGAVPA